MNFEPTDAYPGSARKLDIMRERYQNNLPLFHRLDKNTLDGETDVPVTNKSRLNARGVYSRRTCKVISSGKKIRAE